MYFMVVEMCWWPASSWMAFVGAALEASIEQKVCRRRWIAPVSSSPARFWAEASHVRTSLLVSSRPLSP
jgi:hypothetical protein